tara:strand:+ start:23 stop:316 length:294 start_codon:yes stop_codon:yes gene_type:complete
MTSKHFSGEKAEREEAVKQLMIHAASEFDGRFTARFENDDGGSHIVLVIEVEEPSLGLDPLLMKALFSIKWMGWRYVIVKVPPGYVDAIMNAKKYDD